MADTSLNLSMDDLTGEVGTFLGWGRDSTKWSTDKARDVKECVASCLRKFYYQAQVDPRDECHTWTFLKPVATILLTVGEKLAQLPEDFGGFEGMATVSLDGVSGGFFPLKQIHEEQIRARYAAQPSIIGRPIAYAEQQIKGTSKTKSNRSQMIVFPIPDASYTLSVPYYFMTEYLTVNNPYPYGGGAHAETMKAGARAAAELFMDGQKGEQDANYMMCLAASISYDRRHQPKSLGVNSDHSDWLQHRRGANWPSGLWHPLGVGFLSEGTYT